MFIFLFIRALKIDILKVNINTLIPQYYGPPFSRYQKQWTKSGAANSLWEKIYIIPKRNNNTGVTSYHSTLFRAQSRKNTNICTMTKKRGGVVHLNQQYETHRLNLDPAAILFFKCLFLKP